MTPPRVLLAHKFFFEFGGIERHLFDVRALLAQRGHDVVDFAMADPRNAPSPYSADFVSRVDFRSPSRREAWRAFGRMLYSFEARRRVARLVDRVRPDVAHLLSFYHHLSPSILHPLRRRGIPIVQKLADYKIVCPVYTLLSHGAVCERCAGGRVWQVAVRRCSDGRFGPSAALALESMFHRFVLGSQRQIDLFLAPSRFLKDKVLAMGLGGPVWVVPNFVALDRWRPAPLPAAPVIAYAGRLAPEKGLGVLLKAAEGFAFPVRVYGDGPERLRLEREARARGLDNVEFAGSLPVAALRDALRDCTALVLPAIWYENNPHAVLEAYALGRPVIATEIGGLPEVVVHGETGLLVPPNEPGSLRDSMRALCEDRGLTALMGRRARQFVETRHSPSVFYEHLAAAYREVGA